MLETLRAASKSWVAAILIGMLILSFAIWGINDIFSRSSATWIAKVGDEEIDQRTFESEFLKQIRRMPGPDGKAMTSGQARQLGYDRMVLDGMISDLAVLHEAQRLKLGASDQMVLDEIRKIDGLRKADGSIDQVALQRGLDSIGMTEAQFVQAQRESIMRSQLLESAVVGVPAPITMAKALAAYENERRTVEYIVLPVEKAGEIPAPDDKTLQAFIEANPAPYTAPELRGITLLSVGPDDLLPAIEVTEDEVKAEYEATKAQFETLEKRELQQLTYPTKEEAEAARKQIDEGKTFDDLAAAQKKTTEDISLGVLTKGTTDVPAGAFEVAEGEVTQPLQSDFGWVLIKVVKIEPGTAKSFDEVRQQIHDKLARDKAIDKLVGLRDQLEDGLAATDTLQGAADALKDVVKVNVRTIPAIDAQGNDIDGKPIAGLPDGPAFLRDVAASEQGDKGDLSDTPEHVFYVIQTDSVTAPALRKLADVHDKAAAAWLAAEETNRLQTLADETAKSANAAGESAADLAKQLGLEAKTAEKLARDAAVPDLTPPLVAALYKAKPGEWVTGLSASPNVAIARVKEITSDAPPDAADQERALRTAETRAMASDLADLYRKAIVAAGDVEVDEAKFNSLKARGQ